MKREGCNQTRKDKRTMTNKIIVNTHADFLATDEAEFVEAYKKACVTELTACGWDVVEFEDVPATYSTRREIDNEAESPAGDVTQDAIEKAYQYASG